MENGRIKVWLSPLNGGSYTKLQLIGVVPTAVPQREIVRLVKKMSFMSGYPLECALSVDEETDGWFEWWNDRLAVIPEHHLKVRFIVRDKRYSNERDGR